MSSDVSIEIMTSYVESLLKRVITIHRSNIERFSKYALNALTEFRNLVAQMKEFLKKSQCLYNALCKNSNNCRLCHRWIYTSINGNLVFKKLIPLITISFNGKIVTVTTENSKLEITPLTWKLKLNELEREIRIDDENALKSNLGIIVNTLAPVKVALMRGIEDLDLCSKEHSLTC